MSKLKATEFSIGIPRTDPNIQLDELSSTSSTGQEESVEKDAASMV